MELWERNRVFKSYVASADGPDDVHIACEQAPGEPERSPITLLSEIFFRPRREPVRRLMFT